jgi:hypothetical protein
VATWSRGTTYPPVVGIVLRAGQRRVEVGPGHLLFKPRGQWHTFWNVADLADVVTETPVALAYALHPAALLIGGMLLLRRSARTDLGLGLVLAAGAATTVPAVLIVTALASVGVADSGGPVVVLLLGVCVVVIIVGARALTEVRRSSDLRLALRPITGLGPWILAGLAVAGGVALTLNAFRYTVHAGGGSASWLGWPAF